MSYWKGRKRGPQSPEHRAKTVINLKPGWNKGLKGVGAVGIKHGMWKGDEVGYYGIHSWIKRTYGSPKLCEEPLCDGISRIYEWAKVKGKPYVRKRENFIQLCHKCHANYDKYFSKAMDIIEKKRKGNTYRRIDLVGQRFGKLVVVSLAGKNKWGNLKFLCKCDCGKDKVLPSASFKCGRTKSCGCLVKEIMMGNKYRVGKEPWNKGLSFS